MVGRQVSDEENGFGRPNNARLGSRERRDSSKRPGKRVPWLEICEGTYRFGHLGTNSKLINLSIAHGWTLDAAKSFDSIPEFKIRWFSLGKLWKPWQLTDVERVDV